MWIIKWKGSFFQIPKTFTIYDSQGQIVSQITKTLITLLPQFEIKLSSGHSFYIRKKFSFA